MRRSDRECTDRVEIDGILDSASELRLGLWDGQEVYVVPLNFVRIDGALFFHSATQGRKIDILKKNPRVCFEVTGQRHIEAGKTGGDCTTRYESVIGWGSASFIETSAEKNRILSALNKKFSAPEGPFPENLLARTMVIQIRVDRLTAKVNRSSM